MASVRHAAATHVVTMATGRVRSLLMDGEVAQATRGVQRVVAAHPSAAYKWLVFAEAALEAGHLEASMNALHRLPVGFRTERFVEVLARIQDAMGEPRAAHATRAGSLATAPAVARSNVGPPLETVESARRLVTHGLLQDALRMLRRLVMRRPDDDDAQRLLLQLRSKCTEEGTV
ncbi:MAG: hypothetical protein ACON5B_04395 [Myxococcota bacterium]